MPELTLKRLKAAILSALAEPGLRKAHKHNLIGRPYQIGTIEKRLEVQFDQNQRAMAARAFDELRIDSYIQPTFDDLSDPENWCCITASGKAFLDRGLRDNIDLRLAAIGQHLVDLRSGMHDAAARTSPDAPRQATHSARELIAQVLKEGANEEDQTRKQRAKRIMERSRTGLPPSNSDIEIIDACCRLIDAEHNKAVALAHARQSVSPNEARAVVEATERVLCLLFPAYDDRD